MELLVVVFIDTIIVNNLYCSLEGVKHPKSYCLSSIQELLGKSCFLFFCAFYLDISEIVYDGIVDKLYEYLNAIFDFRQLFKYFKLICRISTFLMLLFSIRNLNYIVPTKCDHESEFHIYIILIFNGLELIILTTNRYYVYLCITN
uniref:Uncharacterized protein n=1 Tax=Heterorhabditis bacteriophora TaxID=37862 RepID=A0A1I7WEE1_HETBA